MDGKLRCFIFCTHGLALAVDTDTDLKIRETEGNNITRELKDAEMLNADAEYRTESKTLKEKY